MPKISLDQLAKLTQSPIATTGLEKPLLSPTSLTSLKRPGVVHPGSDLEHKEAEDILNVSKTTRKAVVLLTPFVSEDPQRKEQAIRYTNRCISDSLKKNESPISNQAFYAKLDPSVKIERDMGLLSILTWIQVADMVVVYVDFGVTGAMKTAIEVAGRKNKKVEYRTIGSIA